MDLPAPFRDPPDHGKLALAGAWEQAVAFEPGELTTTAEALEYLDSSEEVACEAFFGKAFFGVRRRGRANELAQFMSTFAQAIQTSATGAEFFAALQKDLGIGPSGSFLYAELGAEGAWASVGPVRIEPQSDARGVMEALAHTALAHDTVHDMALEFTYDNGDGSTYWIAWPVSRDTGVEEDLISQALDWFSRS